MKLSIIVPAYNEGSTIAALCEKIEQVQLMGGIEKEIIIVDDSSTDQTGEMVLRYTRENPDCALHYLRHETNRGKGAALRTGFQRATGDFVIVQDADLEYDPQEYNVVLKPVLDGVADVVYGSRFAGGSAHRVLFFWHMLGNKFLTLLSNMFTNLNLTDMESCYKLFRADIIKSLRLEEDRFGFEPEVTAKIARMAGTRIYEVGVSYYGRTYREGKKIGWKDGIRAVYCIIKYGLFR